MIFSDAVHYIMHGGGEFELNVFIICAARCCPEYIWRGLDKYYMNVD